MDGGGMIQGEAMLAWLRERRSIRRFTDQPIDRGVLLRVLQAAITAPSATNRQPWRFAAVTSAAMKRRIANAARARTEELEKIIAPSPHASEVARYADFFFEPLQQAAALVVPQYCEYPDHLAHLIAVSGANGADFETPGSMQVEICGASAAVMLLLLQARAEGLGACWMAGPSVARRDIQDILGIADPYRMLGVVALGYPAEQPAATARRPLERAVTWFEDDHEPG
jgi:nitroreductase